MEHRTGLPPVIGKGPKVLVLGTIPSVLSDRKQEYYGNPQNRFWKVVYGIFDEDADPDYERRLEFLKGKGIALWDVLRECDINGSKDYSIENPVANDIVALLRQHEGIAHVFINGKKAQKLYEGLIQGEFHDDMKRPMMIVLPSTSTANPVPFLEKVRAWKIIRQALSN
ncbi:MAG: DNA-deoxyinosine glycosylase [Methanomassiliicoccales archaeon]|nr:DNA-deoxyinosine glycosylase [Methanomassiliicoccales archaeon]